MGSVGLSWDGFDATSWFPLEMNNPNPSTLQKVWFTANSNLKQVGQLFQSEPIFLDETDQTFHLEMIDPDPTNSGSI